MLYGFIPFLNNFYKILRSLSRVCLYVAITFMMYDSSWWWCRRWNCDCMFNIYIQCIIAVTPQYGNGNIFSGRFFYEARIGKSGRTRKIGGAVNTNSYPKWIQTRKAARQSWDAQKSNIRWPLVISVTQMQENIKVKNKTRTVEG